MLLELKQTTYQEFRQIEFDEDDNAHYELLNGEIMKKSAPTPYHQRLVRNVCRVIDKFINENKYGEILFSPIDVFLDEYNVPQPDLVYLSNEKVKFITNDGIMGVPDLIIEIISPSSILKDRITKKNVYERFGVEEYWLIDANNQEIEIYVIENGEYELFSSVSLFEENELKSKVLSDLRIDLRELF
jgi:Uma2 family endonuclease